MVKNEVGSLTVITGPMFAGKTSKLLDFMERAAIAGKSVVLFKPIIDKRYSENSVVTHKGIKFNSLVVGTDKEGTDAILKISKDFDVIGIDEAQFWNYESDLDKVLDKIAFSRKEIYVSLLNRDYMGLPFGISPRILALADRIYSLNAVCIKCGSDATLTQRIINNKESFSKQIVVGGTQEYEARCRNCFVKMDS